jgi:hypothetical protein
MADIDYDGVYELNETLKSLPGYLPSPKLGNFDGRQLLREGMVRLAMPLPDGRSSPFSSQNPFSAHGLILSQNVFYQLLVLQELNLVPDYTFLQWLRFWGIELQEADYPRLRLRFYRQEPRGTIEGSAFIPVGTQVQHFRDETMYAITTEYKEIFPNQSYVDIEARLNRRGKLSPNTSAQDFTYMPNDITYVIGVEGIEVIDPGREQETLSEVVVRARRQMQVPTGIMNDSHYYFTALNLGADKAMVLPGIVREDDIGKYADLTTVIVYPPNLANFIKDQMIPLKLSGSRIDVQGAEVFPLEGSIDCSIDPAATNQQVLNKVVPAITEEINPPAGNWGDRNFMENLAGTLVRRSPEIYGIPSMNLYHAQTGETLESLEKRVKPWHLFKLMDSVVFNWLRGNE